MSRAKYILLIISIVGVMACLLPCRQTSAISDKAKAEIPQKCNSIKTSLKKIQKSDSRTRVFLGTSYEHILTNFISPLNIRLAKNNHPDSSLSDLQNQFASKRSDFSNTFTEYMKSLETLTNTDCYHDVDIFYKRLEETRSQRNKLNQLTKDLRELTIKDFQIVNKLKDTL